MTQKVHAKIQVERETGECEVNITALFCPARPAWYQADGDTGWAEEVYILSATLDDGTDAFLADGEIGEAVGKVLESVWNNPTLDVEADRPLLAPASLLWQTDQAGASSKLSTALSGEILSDGV